jgi:release factor glutamine methyltransferase
VRTLRGASDSPRLDAELLLCAVLDVARPALIARGTLPIDVARQREFTALVARRAGGEPVAYLTGTREFWSLPLKVTPDVLVPRPETEVLVELALERLPASEARSVLDLGTGSGAIALAIASERPRARVLGVDVSARALAVAMSNSRALGLDRVEWRAGFWFDAVEGMRFDLIAANPPYIAADDPAMARLAAEPALALTSGPTGLEAFVAIIEAAGAHLTAGGWLLLEHGAGQAAAVAGMLVRHGFRAVRSHQDYAGLPRVTAGAVAQPAESIAS